MAQYDSWKKHLTPEMYQMYFVNKVEPYPDFPHAVAMDFDFDPSANIGMALNINESDSSLIMWFNHHNEILHETFVVYYDYDKALRIFKFKNPEVAMLFKLSWVI